MFCLDWNRRILFSFFFCLCTSFILMKGFFLAMALLLVGCHRSFLTCRSEYLYPKYLASEQINTPDPCRRCYYGQQIHIYWNLPKKNSNKEAILKLHIRYGNRQMETVFAPLSQHSGWQTFRLLNQEYWCKGGILSYKAEILIEGEPIAEWRHFLWAEIINIPIQ